MYPEPVVSTRVVNGLGRRTAHVHRGPRGRPVAPRAYFVCLVKGMFYFCPAPLQHHLEGATERIGCKWCLFPLPWYTCSAF